MWIMVLYVTRMYTCVWRSEDDVRNGSSLDTVYLVLSCFFKSKLCHHNTSLPETG